jgi:hypothetical protein
VPLPQLSWAPQSFGQLLLLSSGSLQKPSPQTLVVPQSSGQLAAFSLHTSSHLPLPQLGPHSLQSGGPQSLTQSHGVSPCSQAPSPHTVGGWQSMGQSASLSAGSQVPSPQ